MSGANRLCTIIGSGGHSHPFKGEAVCATNEKVPFLSGADGVVSEFNKVGALRGSLITAPPSRSNVLIARSPRLGKAENVYFSDFWAKRSECKRDSAQP
jgi:hypothetical protein